MVNGKGRRTVKDWQRVVFRCQSVRSVTKVGLIYLSHHMRADRTVSRPRRLIADALGISERTVDRIVVDAHEAGLLSTVVRGRKGVTAVYQGIFPDPVQSDTPSRAETAQTVALKTDISPFSATTCGAPVVTTGEPEPFGCEVCGDAGCSECCS